MILQLHNHLHVQMMRGLFIGAATQVPWLSHPHMHLTAMTDARALG
jgi:hypothetical protein